MNYENLYATAVAAGYEAAKKANPRPMVVQERSSPLDDGSPVVKEWLVPSGVCGFAWVNVKPGNSAFAKWLKAKGVARPDSYYGGVTIWVKEFGQSMELKEAYAYAMAKVMSEAGFKAYANSRMD